MKQYLSFSATREVAEAGIAPAPQLRRTQEVARQSLINVGGLTYPLLQRASMWTDVDEIDDGVYFTFNRQRPLGDVRFEKDFSFLATREPLNEEAEMIFLESLTWEFVFTLLFFNQFIKVFNRPGTFRIGLGFSGFQDTLMDWAGFEAEAATTDPRLLVNWRFRPPRDVVSFETPNVEFPCEPDELVSPISETVAEVSFAVRGIRHTPLNINESRLTLIRQSIESVVRHALSRVPQP